MQIFDGHNDTLSRFSLGAAQEEEFFTGGAGHLDWPKAQAGGFAGGMFALFAPHRDMMEENGLIVERSLPPEIYRQQVASVDAESVVQAGIATFARLEKLAEGRFRMARTVAEIEESMADGAIAAVMHFEGAEPIHADLSNLEAFYDLGLRSIGLVWSRDNHFGSGVGFEFPGTPEMGEGLTEAGKDLVRACNRLGIVVDMSHLNAAGFRDVAATSTAPLVATHSCIHALCPMPRNLMDWQLEAIAATDGIVGINFAVPFLRADGRRQLDTPLSVMVEHFRYVAEKIGVRHVGIGSDFDGTSVPQAIGDAAGLQNLVQALRDGGFSEEELELIGWKNWLRVLGASW